MTELKLKLNLYTLIVTILQYNWSCFAVVTVAKTNVCKKFEVF